MKYIALLIAALSFAMSVKSQEQILPTPALERLDGIAKRKSMEENSLVKNVMFRNVGPTIMSGRAVDVDVNPDDPTEFYVAYASGGLWHTVNNGQSFTPLFDREDAITIGDIAVDWKTRMIWVGTGEANSSRSSYAGTGVYVSTDSGKTWMHKGLAESHHIGKVLLHPSVQGTAWVAALGHLYSPNKDRGVYKTTDGGNTWKQVLSVDENTGAVDLAIDSSNADILYAAMWHRERRAWNFTESGAGSGLYKSKDGGNTWTLLTKEGSGFPTGEGIGRIGISIFPKNPSIIYAVLDNQNKKPDEDKRDTAKLDVKDLKDISKENFLKLDDKKLDAFLRAKEFPEKYTASVVKDLVRKDSISQSSVLEYLNDANNSLFDTPVIGAEIYRSDDAGVTWKKTNDGPIKNLFYSYGYYFGKIFVSPFDDKKIVLCGVPLIMSIDGGKSFKTIDGDNTHGDHHTVWFNPKKEKHMIICNDGGLNITYDEGANWFKANSPPVGQFYSIAVDMEKPYNVYGGLQDNGVWTGPSTYDNNKSWLQEGQYPYKFIMNGDGMQVQVDTRDNATVYTGFQFGYYFQLNKNNPDNAASVKPKNDLGEPNYRFNWQTPVWLSRHNQDILYLGSNRFHRSMNKGEDMKVLSADLTHHDKKGDVPFNTITSIGESPLRFGLVYLGTDDGYVWISKDVGYSWTNISSGLPHDLYTSRVVPSAKQEGRLYVTLNGYRNDHFNPYVFCSEDYGTSWHNITANLPDEPVNVIREDPANDNILYIGTDNGLYLSLDRGKTYMSMNGGLPRVAVHDIAVHPRDHELVAATHGRSIYIASVKEIQELNDSILSKDLSVFDFEVPSFNKNWGKKHDDFSEPVRPSVIIPFYLKTKGLTTIKIMTTKGDILKTLTDTSEAGLNYLNYDLGIDSVSIKALEKSLSSKNKSVHIIQAEDKRYYLVPGTYEILFSDVHGHTEKKSLEVKDKSGKESDHGGMPVEKD